MAQPPQPPPKPAAPPPLRNPAEGKPPAVGGGHVTTQEERDKVGPGGYRPTIGVKGEPIEDAERDPDTIAEEQRRRSEEMERVGIDKWKAAHDERKGENEEARKQVAGAAQAKIESHRAP